MLYDLNVPWAETQSPSELQRTISFLSELGYDTIALNHTLNSQISSPIVNPIPTTLSFPLPPKTVILRRCTVHIDDPSQNHRLANLAAVYDILALRPTSERGFLAACNSLTEHSIISLDLTTRHQFNFKPKPFMTAIHRGLFFEISYGQATLADSNAKRNFISNTLGIIRATRGKGLIISSEARNVLGIRAPADVVNLMNVWGLGNERGREAMGVNPRGVVVNEGLKRSAFRGVIDVVDGGESLVEKSKDALNSAGKEANSKGKRKAEHANGEASKESTPQSKKQNQGESTPPPLSKRAAKRARLEALKASKEISKEAGASSSSQPNTTPGPNPTVVETLDSTRKFKANG